MPFRDIAFGPGSFDTVVMYGNGFGLFASRGQARRLYTTASPKSKILCSSVDPYNTDNPDHVQYQRWNRARGRMPGQVKIRVRYRTYVGGWFDYLLVSPDEMEGLVKRTGWRVRRFLRSSESPLYVGVLEKEVAGPIARRLEPV